MRPFSSSSPRAVLGPPLSFSLYPAPPGGILGTTTARSGLMAEILGLGVTHWPTLCLPNEGLTSVFKRTLTAPNVEARYKDRANWPDELIAELGNDDGLSAANRCGERFGKDFRAIRKILDDFNPDLVVVWGDDQYENF